MMIATAIDTNLLENLSCSSFHDLDLTDAASFEEEVRNTCGFLVYIKDSKISFAHQTAKEYLKEAALTDVSLWCEMTDAKAPDWILGRIC